MIEYFNSKTIKAKEPELVPFAGPEGELIQIWNTQKGTLGITKNKEDSYTIWNLENMVPIAHPFENLHGNEIFTRDYAKHIHAFQNFPNQGWLKASGFAMAPDGETIAIALLYNSCILWDVLNDRAHMGLISYGYLRPPIEITPDGRLLIISREDTWD